MDSSLERVRSYVAVRRQMRGIDPEQVHTAMVKGQEYSLDLSDLDELIELATFASKVRQMRLIVWNESDWMALVDGDGNLLDQGHIDDLSDRVIADQAKIHIFPAQGGHGFGRRIPEGTNLAEYLS